jgi:hypothetical protein
LTIATSLAHDSTPFGGLLKQTKAKNGPTYVAETTLKQELALISVTGTSKQTQPHKTIIGRRIKLSFTAIL